MKKEAIEQHNVPNITSDNSELKKVVQSDNSIFHGYCYTTIGLLLCLGSSNKIVAYCKMYKKELPYRVKARYDNNLHALNQTNYMNDFCEAETVIIMFIHQKAFRNEIAALKTSNVPFCTSICTFTYPYFGPVLSRSVYLGLWTQHANYQPVKKQVAGAHFCVRCYCIRCSQGLFLCHFCVICVQSYLHALARLVE